jgi:2-oxoisovalerate dehydrogenase E1 component
VVRSASTSLQDLRSLAKNDVARLLFTMRASREFELAVLEWLDAGVIDGPIHTSVGQEVVAAAALLGAGPNDMVFGSHRAHHHLVTLGIHRSASIGWQATGDSPGEDAREFLKTTMRQVAALQVDGRGVGGSMHLRNASVGFGGTSAIVGGSIPIATGSALGSKLRADGGAAVCFLGDGAVNQGVFHEAANLASLLAAPLLLVIENNRFAEATTPAEASAVVPLASQAAAHGIPSWYVDGEDVPAVVAAMTAAWETVRGTGGPAAVEVLTYRHLDHTGGRPGSMAGYRPRAEELTRLERDPLNTLPQQLIEVGLFTSVEVHELQRSAVDFVRSAVNECEFGTSALQDSASHPTDSPVVLRTNSIPRGPQPEGAGFREVVASAILERLSHDDRVVLLGEEVGKPGGSLAYAEGFDPSAHESRVINTPISEAGFVGLGAGLALGGFRPIVELMYGSFSLVAADQLFNHIGMMRAMFGRDASCPVIVRARVPRGQGYGPQHGLNPIGLFSLFPEWQIYAPSSPREWLNAFDEALASQDPTLIVEFSDLDRETLTGDGLATPKNLSAQGALKTVREGADISLVAYGATVGPALDAAAFLADRGLHAEVLELTRLDAEGIAYEEIERRITTTGAAIFVEPLRRSQALAPRIFSRIELPPGTRLSMVTDAEVQPAAKALEREAIVRTDWIVREVENVLKTSFATAAKPTADMFAAR